jgi:3-methyl-2-oxobutanoate hydroxymethyltransferase
LAKLTVAGLQQMKRDGKKIAAAVVYDVPMTRIFERAEVDLLSVGDSFASYLFGAKMEDVSVDEILPFAKAVVRAAERAVVSVDIPIAVCSMGATEVLKAARRFKEEAGPDMAKLFIPAGEEGLVEQVHAVREAGLAAYCRVRYPGARSHSDIRSSPEGHAHVLKWAHAVQEAGASLIDLYQGPSEIYEQTARRLRIPVIGGQWATRHTDGKIFVYPNLVGYRGDAIDCPDGRPSAASFIYDIVEPAVAEVHAGAW